MRIKVIVLGLLISLLVFGAAKKKEKLPQLMHEFYGALLDLKPYMTSIDDFQNPKNKEHVLTVLKDLEKKIESTEVHDLKAPGFNVTYDLLARHLRDTTYLYEKEIYSTAWVNLRATTQFCIACHDRLPKGVGKMNWPVSLNLESAGPKEMLREADFLYIGHRFDEALRIYDKVIRSYKTKPQATEKNIDLDEAYQRKIALFSRIERDPKAAIASLKEDLKNESLPLDTKKNIETWIHYFDLWSREGKADPSKLSDSNLIDYARDIVEKSSGGRRIAVSDPYVINLLRVSGLLYERVFKQKKSASTPEMLYLLGKCEQDLAPIRFYSLSDIYFKECILEARKSPIARKCFSEYELSIRQKFRSGASDYINAGLEELRKLSH